MFSVIKANVNARVEKESLEDIQRILTCLKFIGKIRPGEKIDVNQLVAQPQGLFTSICRFLFGQSRETTLDFITETIERAFVIINHIVLDNKKEVLSKCVLSGITEALAGLLTIKQTYFEIDDRIYVSRIETISDFIIMRLAELCDEHPTLFSNIKLDIIKNDIKNKILGGKKESSPTQSKELNIPPSSPTNIQSFPQSILDTSKSSYASRVGSKTTEPAVKVPAT